MGEMRYDVTDPQDDQFEPSPAQVGRGCTCSMELEGERIVALDPDCPLHGSGMDW